jgi:UDP-N-acetylmuramoyl-L-alanyl-D-glutamate--2,6-diaminopimelate ligase
VNFDVALLTNLTRDHLDFHGDMQSYAAAKRRLFDWEELKHAVLNLDDAYGVELAEQLQGKQVEVIGYGLNPESLQLAERLGIRMVSGAISKMDAQGLILRLHTSWGAAIMQSRLVGRFNASNLLGALAVLLVSEANIDDAVRELGLQKPVAGRMQTLGSKGTPTVVVDYAHTPDALEKVLNTLREVTEPSGGKVICMFGCGGDRDRGKRPMMGTIASKYADVRIITNDNPRSEEPDAIIAEIAAGMHGEYLVIGDRAKAITQAINNASPKDTVLLAGKGHEDYQEIKGERQPFSDAEIAHRVLSMWEPQERWS